MINDIKQLIFISLFAVQAPSFVKFKSFPYISIGLNAFKGH